MGELTFESAIKQSGKSGCGETPETVEETDSENIWSTNRVMWRVVIRNNVKNAGMIRNAFTW